MKFDSVKIFYFNKKKYEVEHFSLIVDTPNIYNVFEKPEGPYINVKGSLTDDKGKLLEKTDDDELTRLLKFSYVDHYDNDPVSPYSPKLGFVFFRNGVSCAHIDISFAYDKIEMEISGKNNVFFRYKWSVIGRNIKSFIISSVSKYKVPDWVLH